MLDFTFIRKFFLFAFLVLVVSSCQKQQTQNADNSNMLRVNSIMNTLLTSQPLEKTTKESILTESFVNDSDIAVSRKNKIELSMFKDSDENFVEIKFYSLDKDSNWQLKQNVKHLKDGSSNLEVQIKDFNNDGLKDITFVSGIAARGANEIRNLFIYDQVKNELVYIKNSSDYPNLEYNKRLNSLTAQRFYGGTATDFLKIDNDTLVQFAYVESFGKERTVYKINGNNEKKLLRKYKINEDEIFERFVNYDPLEIDSEEK